MPRFVDPDERKAEILSAVVDALSDGGFPKFTLRSLAKRMGGSSTLITHYFPTRESLIEALLDDALLRAEEKCEELLQIDDPHERLHAVLEYFLPADEESLALERVRIALVAHRGTEPGLDGFFARLEPGMRAVIRVALEEFVNPKDLDGMVDLLRAWTSGVALSAVEHPEIWTPKRQRATLNRFLDSLSLPLKEPKRKLAKATS